MSSGSDTSHEPTDILQAHLFACRLYMLVEYHRYGSKHFPSSDRADGYPTDQSAATFPVTYATAEDVAPADFAGRNDKERAIWDRCESR